MIFWTNEREPEKKLVAEGINKCLKISWRDKFLLRFSFIFCKQNILSDFKTEPPEY